MDQQFVTKYYQMDPETEDVLFDGSFLKIGMVVLIEDPKMRLDPDDEANLSKPERFDYLLRYNRWGKILNMRINLAEDSVDLMLEYPDGTKRKISQEIRHAWIVKKNSLQAEAVGVARVRPPWMSEFKEELFDPSLEEMDPSATNVMPLVRRVPKDFARHYEQLPALVDDKERFFPPQDME